MDMTLSRKKLEKESFNLILTKKLKQLTEAFASDPFDLSKSSKIIELLSFVEMFNFPTDLAQAQNIVFAVCKKLPEHIKQNQLIKVLCAKLNLNLE